MDFYFEERFVFYNHNNLIVFKGVIHNAVR